MLWAGRGGVLWPSASQKMHLPPGDESAPGICFHTLAAWCWKNHFTATALSCEINTLNITGVQLNSLHNEKKVAMDCTQRLLLTITTTGKYFTSVQ